MHICSDGGLFAASAAASAVSRRLDRISSPHAPASRRLFGRKRSRKGSAVPGGERAPPLDETALQSHTPSTCKPKAAGSPLPSFTCISSPPYVRTCLRCCAAEVLSGEAEEIAKASVARNSSAAAEAAYHIAATPFKVPRHICTARRQLCHLSGMQDDAVAECLTTTFQPRVSKVLWEPARARSCKDCTQCESRLCTLTKFARRCERLTRELTSFRFAHRSLPELDVSMPQTLPRARLEPGSTPLCLGDIGLDAVAEAGCDAGGAAQSAANGSGSPNVTATVTAGRVLPLRAGHWCGLHDNEQMAPATAPIDSTTCASSRSSDLMLAGV